MSKVSESESNSRRTRLDKHRLTYCASLPRNCQALAETNPASGGMTTFNST